VLNGQRHAGKVASETEQSMFSEMEEKLYTAAIADALDETWCESCCHGGASAATLIQMPRLRAGSDIQCRTCLHPEDHMGWELSKWTAFFSEVVVISPVNRGARSLGRITCPRRRVRGAVERGDGLFAMFAQSKNLAFRLRSGHQPVDSAAWPSGRLHVPVVCGGYW